MPLDFGALIRNASGIAGGLHTGRQQAEDRERQTEMSALEQLLMNAQIKRQEAMTGEDKSRGRYYDAQAGRYQAEAEKEARELREEADRWRLEFPEQLAGATDRVAAMRGPQLARHANALELRETPTGNAAQSTGPTSAEYQRFRTTYQKGLESLAETRQNSIIGQDLSDEEFQRAISGSLSPADSSAVLEQTLRGFEEFDESTKASIRQQMGIRGPTEPVAPTKPTISMDQAADLWDQLREEGVSPAEAERQIREKYKVGEGGARG